MAWTQADIDALKAALKTGMRRIQFADQEFEWHSLTEGLELLARMEREVGKPPAYRVAATKKGV